MGTLIFIVFLCFVLSLFNRKGKFEFQSYPRYTTVRRHYRKGTYNGVRQHKRRISDGVRVVWVPHLKNSQSRKTNINFSDSAKNQKNVEIVSDLSKNKLQIPHSASQHTQANKAGQFIKIGTKKIDRKTNVNNFLYRSELLRDIGNKFPVSSFKEGYIELNHTSLGNGFIKEIRLREKASPLFTVKYEEKVCTHNTDIFHSNGLINKIKVNENFEKTLLSCLSGNWEENASVYRYDPRKNKYLKDNFFRSTHDKDRLDSKNNFIPKTQTNIHHNRTSIPHGYGSVSSGYLESYTGERDGSMYQDEVQAFYEGGSWSVGEFSAEMGHDGDDY